MSRKTRLSYDRYEVPDHTQQALEDYFFHGYEPGSFLMSVLCNDLMGAVNRCDHINREHIVDIAKWVMHTAPCSSWGNRAMVMDWVNDTNGTRTKFVDEFEKRLMWETLATNG
jgi:hypothetical protein